MQKVPLSEGRPEGRRSQWWLGEEEEVGTATIATGTKGVREVSKE